MLEWLRRHLRDLRGALNLFQHCVARVAILADDFAVLADVIAIVAAEATLEVEMPDVVGMRLPVQLHVRKERRAIDALQFGH